MGVAALVAAAALAACSGSSRPEASAGVGGSSTSAAARNGATVWLCRPGEAEDPCAVTLASTSVSAAGARTRSNPAVDEQAPFDCFYVYPTVSPEGTDNADLTIEPAERLVAEDQAAQFSSVCRVWAPMYRQVTDHGLLDGAAANPADLAVAFDSLLASWEDYLAHDNDGRPIVFIGHSQGAAMLIRLLQAEVDGVPAVRARVVSAIVVGGNVTVPVGGVVGATFAHLPLCRVTGQDGCVIAYSTFPDPPPATALFGRPGQGVSLMSGQVAKAGVAVACTNPAALGGGAADLGAIFPTAQFPPHPKVPTPWVMYPDLYRAQCESAGGATWLQVDTVNPAGRPVVTQQLGPDWGYHVEDVNLALGNLVADVAAAEQRYTADS